MTKQALVVGLGQFGMSVARALAEKGADVLAVDVREERVRAVASSVAEAVCFDVTNAEALSRLSPDRRDVAVCAIGDDSRDASILCTALLRQQGAPRVLARANDPLHARILHLVGAHEVVNPEQEFGERLASRIVYERLIGELPLGEDLLISELRPPPAFVGRSLAELQLPRNYGITVVAIRRGEEGKVKLPESSDRLRDDDVLVVVSRERDVARLFAKE